jgi:hypothetical protein
VEKESAGTVSLKKTLKRIIIGSCAKRGIDQNSPTQVMARASEIWGDLKASGQLPEDATYKGFFDAIVFKGLEAFNGIER